MPFIDVSDITLDPDIAGNVFSVIRRQETVDSNGNQVITPTTITGLLGAIYPTGDQGVVREEAYSSQNDTITVVTEFRLRGPSTIGGQTFATDIVVWNGNNYQVKTLNEYTQYGAGFIEAECVSINYVPQAAT